MCVEWTKGKLTSKEALRNLGELINVGEETEKDHYWGVIDKIMESELPTNETDEDLDAAYWNETHKES